MSCYNWERGTFVIPDTAYAVLKKQLIEVRSEFLRKSFVIAQELHAHLKPLHEADPKADLNFIACEYGHTKRSWMLDKYDFTTEFLHALYYVAPQEWGSTGGRLYKLVDPVKADFVLDGNADLIDGRQWSIRFDDAKKSLAWSVEEGNRSVEEARDSSTGRRLFSALENMRWTPGTGGDMVGYDQEMREQEHDENGYGPDEAFKESFGPRR